MNQSPEIECKNIECRICSSWFGDDWIRFDHNFRIRAFTYMPFGRLHLQGKILLVTANDITSNDTVIERGNAENNWWLLRVGQQAGDA